MSRQKLCPAVSSNRPRCGTVRQINPGRHAIALLRQPAGVPDVAQSSFIGVSINCADFLWGHSISPSTQLSNAREKRQHVTAETQGHDREANNDRGDAHSFNTEPFPHAKTVAPGQLKSDTVSVWRSHCRCPFTEIHRHASKRWRILRSNGVMRPSTDFNIIYDFQCSTAGLKHRKSYRGSLKPIAGTNAPKRQWNLKR